MFAKQRCHIILAVFDRSVERGLPILVRDVKVSTGRHEKLDTLLVHGIWMAKARCIVEHCVSIVVLRVQRHLALLGEELHQMAVTPERSLVKGRTAGCLLLRVDICCAGKLLHHVSLTVHRCLTKRQARLIAGGGCGAWSGGGAESDELREGLREVFEEECLVFRIHVSVFAELWVGLQGHIGWQHHQVACWVFVLEWAIPLPGLPLLAHQKFEVVVVEFERIVRPGSVVAAAYPVAGSQGVCTTQ